MCAKPERAFLNTPKPDIPVVLTADWIGTHTGLILTPGNKDVCDKGMSRTLWSYAKGHMQRFQQGEVCIVYVTKE